jgi:hypothetical protein
MWRQRWGERGGHFLRVSLRWTLLGLHYHGIGAASRNVAEKFTRTDPRAVGAVPVSNPDSPETQSDQFRFGQSQDCAPRVS